MLHPYKNVLTRLRLQLASGKKIRAGFGVVFDSVFPMAPVFELMMHDDLFDPFIVVIPDAMRGVEHELEQMERTKTALEKMWPDARILCPFSEEKQAYMHINDLCDIWCTANPYDGMTRPPYRTAEFVRVGIPTFFTGYGFTISQKYCDELSKKSGIYSNFWRIYAINPFEYARLSLARPVGSCVLSGYPKMDALAKCIPQKSDRKSVIIAPHHTVDTPKGNVNFSNFLEYATLFSELPELFPEINFVFRPHPLLFTTLVHKGIWSKHKCEIYLENLESKSNSRVDFDASYFQLFADADAIIHDCGSFTAEWLYTGKPGCYMLKDSSMSEYNRLARECLGCYELALSEKDITGFIERTVIAGIDDHEDTRRAMFPKIAVNYPHASETVLADLKKCILGTDE